MINIDDLTLGQIKEIQKITSTSTFVSQRSTLGSEFIGKYVLIRTYSSGVWAGYLEQKQGNEVILRDARRLWRFQCNKSISLSAVAEYGIDQSRSKIAVTVSSVWLEAIEIIEFSDLAKESVITAKEAAQE